jgi:two-component system OmpR family sensor kinase
VRHGPQSIRPATARPRMLCRVRRIGALAVVTLLATLASSLFAATVAVLRRTRGELGADVTLEPLWAPLGASYVLLLVGASFGALYLAHRAARTVEKLFEHQDHLMLAVAHEIRSPLSRTVVALEEGATGVLARETAIEEARVNVGALSSLIDDLLQTARIMSGAVPLPADEVWLDEVVRSSMGAESIGASRVLFDTQPILVVGSPHLIRRGVVNLIRNAAIHGYGQGPGEIRVRVDQTGVTVRDDGPGIPAARLDELRYETPITRRPRGGGLGLLLAGWVAEAHHGRLVLANRPEGGFEARLELPVRADRPAGPRSGGP